MSRLNYRDATTGAEIAEGLRELADLLAGCGPIMRTWVSVDLQVVKPAGKDDERRQLVDRLASAIGGAPGEQADKDTNYSASNPVGCVDVVIYTAGRDPE